MKKRSTQMKMNPDDDHWDGVSSDDKRDDWRDED
jgi:hypothetical protein